MVHQPYYMINFSVVSCMFEIRINDITVLCMNIPGQLSSRVPINFTIGKSGSQEINVNMLPVLGNINIDEKATLTFSIECFDAANEMQYSNTLYEHEFPKIETGKQVPILNKLDAIVMDVPYTLNEKWKNGRTLTGVKKVRQKLNRANRELGDIVRKGQFDKFRELFKNREKTMAISMYLSSKESENRIEGLIRDFQNGFNYVKSTNEALVIYSGYGKKATLKKPNGEPALCFLNTKTKEELMLDIEFYLPNDSEELHII